MRTRASRSARTPGMAAATRAAGRRTSWTSTAGLAGAPLPWGAPGVVVLCVMTANLTPAGTARRLGSCSDATGGSAPASRGRAHARSSGKSGGATRVDGSRPRSSGPPARAARRRAGGRPSSATASRWSAHRPGCSPNATKAGAQGRPGAAQPGGHGRRAGQDRARRCSTATSSHLPGAAPRPRPPVRARLRRRPAQPRRLSVPRSASSCSASGWCRPGLRPCTLIAVPLLYLFLIVVVVDGFCCRAASTGWPPEVRRAGGRRRPLRAMRSRRSAASGCPGRGQARPVPE